jgi:hypothetical protein
MKRSKQNTVTNIALQKAIKKDRVNAVPVPPWPVNESELPAEIEQGDIDQIKKAVREHRASSYRSLATEYGLTQILVWRIIHTDFTFHPSSAEQGNFCEESPAVTTPTREDSHDKPEVTQDLEPEEDPDLDEEWEDEDE